MEGLIVVHGLRVQSILMGKIKLREWEVAGPRTPAVKKQKDERGLLSLFN